MLKHWKVVAGEDHEALSSAEWGKDAHSYIQTGNTRGSQVKGKHQGIKKGRKMSTNVLPMSLETVVLVRKWGTEAQWDGGAKVSTGILVPIVQQAMFAEDALVLNAPQMQSISTDTWETLHGPQGMPGRMGRAGTVKAAPIQTTLEALLSRGGGKAGCPLGGE